MAFDNKGKGVLWSNKYWAEGEKGPKWTGKVTADRDIRAGEDIPLAVWPSERKSETSPVMRMQVDRWKEQKSRPAESRHEASREPGSDDGFSDDIPF